MRMMEVPALAIEQSPGREIYAFGIDGKRIPEFAAVSRARREDDDVSLLGYQRPEVRRHIAEIRAYIESAAAMLPNAIVLAFRPGVTFAGQAGGAGSQGRAGTLRIPLANDGEEPIGFVVDGQQRLAAIRDASIKQFPVFAVAFIAPTEAVQREQFLLVNSVKPLPRGLIHELLPGVEGRLPTHLARRRLPAQIVEVLNRTGDSPLYGCIRTATNPGGRIADNSMLAVLENSLSDGLLWEISQHAGAAMDLEEMSWALFAFWGAVREVWSEIWELKPRRSRLLHGAGVVALGYLMDQMAARFPGDGWPDREFFQRELRRVAPHCRWTDGYWDFGPEQRRRWDEIQNVPREVQTLANHLGRMYRLETRGRREMAWGAGIEGQGER
jgi:DGQHR domain-containing protein